MINSMANPQRNANQANYLSQRHLTKQELGHVPNNANSVYPGYSDDEWSHTVPVQRR